MKKRISIVHEKEEGGGTFDIQYLLCLFEGNKKGPARCLVLGGLCEWCLYCQALKNYVRT